EGGAASRLAGRRQRGALGVGAARAQVPALTDDAPLAHDDGAHQRVRRREAARALGHLQRGAHERSVVRHAGTRASTKRTGSKACRSSIFSPTPTSVTGRCSSRTMRTTMPPLAVPSSLVSATPVRPIVSWNILAWAKPFWPVGA